MKKIRTTNQPRKDDAANGKVAFIKLSSVHSGRPLHSVQTKTRQPTAAVLEQLSGALAEVTEANHPRTFKLLQSGRHKVSRKLIEEACEVTVEAARRDSDAVVRESADLLYHLIVLWFHLGIEPVAVWEEMQTRAKQLGIAEKLPKTPGSNGATDDFDH
jgi:phosphoribosyl-ATP pyrophosphohydrolase